MINLGSYKMLIADELKNLKQILLDRSSLKERAFYFFLNEEPLNYPSERDMSEIEQLCLSVFCTDAPDKQEIIEAQRRKQPIKGMHYTGNLIELSAMAQDNAGLEWENLKSHCDNYSTRNFYILNHLFPNIPSNPPIPQGAIDEISLYLYKDEFPRQEWKPLLFEALQEASDLTDFYVIEQGYLQAMDDNPIIHQVNDIIYVRNTAVYFMKQTERRVKRNIGIVSGIFIVALIGWVVYFIATSWDKAEPAIAAIEICIPLILALIVVFVGFNPVKIEIFNSFTEKITNWVFSRKGFDRSELKEKLYRLGPNHIT